MKNSELYLKFVEGLNAWSFTAAKIKYNHELASRKYPYTLEVEERISDKECKMKAVFSDGSEISAFAYQPARNYKNESEWQKSRYRRYQAKLRTGEADALDQILKTSGIKFTEWVRQNIENQAELAAQWAGGGATKGSAGNQNRSEAPAKGASD